MMKKNKAKEKLINGEPILGIFQGFNSMDLTEMCGYSGYDFIILDTEHGPMSAETCIPMICAAERTNTVPVIRVSENEKSYVLKALDVGAMGIIFPMINTVEDAKKAIFLTKYIQKGDEKRKEFRGMVDMSRAAGMVAASPDAIKYWLDLGVKFITYHQTYIIREALENHITKFKQLLSK